MVLIEAGAISMLLGSPAFVSNPKAAPSLFRALAYSLIANLVSFLGGVPVGLMA